MAVLILTKISLATFGLAFGLGLASFPKKTSPLLPSMVTSWLFFRFLVAVLVPTIQGMLNSREIIAAWEVWPPWSVIIPATKRIAGMKSGVVRGVTKISPRLIFLISLADFIFLTGPETIPGLALMPSRIAFWGGRWVFGWAGWSWLALWWGAVVRGRDWRMKNWFLSLAHSISWGKK